ncbi:type II toxin-antitoxin system VapC family toxin [Micromonospora sp. NPDC048839]|uniref:type II toxin-antitoxin system VapC family toxin n=1 Tax=Micromonospora sp. NPDC048839 TaxID=3155641 RepID=UPI0033CEA806
MIYLDSAAVVKLVRQEACSGDLVTWLNAQGDVPLVSSALVEVEVPRALRRAAPQALIGVPAAVGRLFRLEIDGTVRATATAAAFAEPTLRSLDAIHLATAQVLTNESGTALIAFVSYDRRLLDCAKAAGLPVASPGQN